jgi:hypothetical protein
MAMAESCPPQNCEAPEKECRDEPAKTDTDGDDELKYSAGATQSG